MGAVTMYENDFANHVDAVQALAASGIVPPKAWTELHARYEQFAAMVPGGCGERIVDAVLTGKQTDDMPMQYVLAIAEADATPTAIAAVRNRVQAAVLAQLRTTYAAAAASNYTKAATAFNAAAATFTTSAEAVDVEAVAEEVLDRHDEQRQAWAAAPVQARELDQLLEVLALAAELAGHPIVNDAQYTLVVDDAGVPRREAWAAWDTSTGRCGRWSALLAVGCQLRAHPLDGFTPGTRPAPLEERWTAESRGVFVRELVDPEEAGNYRSPLRTL
jgi:hypothetical protein